MATLDPVTTSENSKLKDEIPTLSEDELQHLRSVGILYEILYSSFSIYHDRFIPRDFTLILLWQIMITRCQ